MSHRVEQVASLLRRVIGQTLSRGLSDPRLDVPALISVTSVDVSPDLRSARIGISVVPEQYENRVVAGLTHSAGHLQSVIAKQVSLRIVPRLSFVLDQSLKREAEILGDIHAAMDRTGPEQPPQESAEAPTEDDTDASQDDAG